jgi:hypothetical protein
MILVCEQCDGTGYLPKGERCPCREEDDTADERRKQMGVVKREKPDAGTSGQILEL